MDKQKLTYFPEMRNSRFKDGKFLKYFAETHIRIKRDGIWYAQKLQVGKMGLTEFTQSEIMDFFLKTGKELMHRAHLSLFKSHEGVDLDQEIEGTRFWDVDPCQLDEEDRIKEILQTF